MQSITRFRTIGALAVIGFALSGCTGGPTEAKWGQISVFGAPQQIMFAYDDRIVLIDPLDGQPSELRDSENQVRVDDQGNARVWSVTATGSGPINFYNSPLPIEENTLLAVAYDHELYEIDPEAARILNPEGVNVPGNVVAQPLITEQYIYVPLSGGNLVALTRPDYNIAWTVETGDQGVWATPLLIENTLYVVSLNHSLYLVNADTGDVQQEVDLGGAIASTPVFVDGSLYIGTFARKILQVSLTGEILAEYSTLDWVWGAPAVADGVLYAGDLGGNVYALRIGSDGFELLWTRKVAGRAIRGTPLVAGDMVVVGARDNNVYWLNRETGAEVIRREVRGEVLADLLLLEPNADLDISEPLVIASTLAREELLVAFTLDNGERRWVYTR